MRDYLASHGASFFAAIREGTGHGFPADTVEALWELVWMGLVTNDTLHPLRSYCGRTEEPRRAARRRRRASARAAARRARSEGRWSLVETRGGDAATANTEWGAATAQQLLTRYGIVTRETVASEAIAGGFSAVYQVLRAMEDAGRIRRGYFVAGLGGAQFAHARRARSAALAPRRARDAAGRGAGRHRPGQPVRHDAQVARDAAEAPTTARADVGRGATRTVGSLVVLVDGLAAGYLRRGERDLLLALPDTEPARTRIAQALARALIQLAAVRARTAGAACFSRRSTARAPACTRRRGGSWPKGFVIGADGLQYRAPRPPCRTPITPPISA